MIALLGLRREVGQQRRKVVGTRAVQARYRAPARRVVVVQLHVIGQDDLVAGWWMDRERYVGYHVGVEGIPIDLENADMRLVIRLVVEYDTVDLDGAIVAGRLVRTCALVNGGSAAGVDPGRTSRTGGRQQHQTKGDDDGPNHAQT